MMESANTRVPIRSIPSGSPEPSEQGARLPEPWQAEQQRETTPDIIVGRFIQAAWRRRFLIFMMILLMLPISIGAAFFLPRTYVARTLLATQESESNFLGRESGQPAPLNQRVAGLEALLKSDQVLLPIVQAEKPTDDLTQARRNADELRRDLTLELIGTDFLEIQLRGNKQEGLGKKLHQILTRFFEVMLTEKAPSATQIVLQNSLDELNAAERKQSAIEARLKDILPAGLQSATERLSTLEKARESGAETEVESELAALKRQIAQYAAIESELKTTRLQAASLRELYQGNLARYGNFPSTRGVSVLSAPGRIKVIDSPNDPLGATVSRLRYLAAGLLGSILIGIGLAWFAELLDNTVRYPEHLVAATGLPVLAQLPRVGAKSNSTAGGKPTTPHRVRQPSRVLAVSRAAAILLVIIAIGYTLGSATSLSTNDSIFAMKRWLIGHFSAAQ